MERPHRWVWSGAFKKLHVCLWPVIMISRNSPQNVFKDSKVIWFNQSGCQLPFSSDIFLYFPLIYTSTNMFSSAIFYTPPKINIEPENGGLEDGSPFEGVYSQVPC